MDLAAPVPVRPRRAGPLARLARAARDGDFRELLDGATSALGMKVLGMAAAYAFTLAVTRMLGAGAWGTFSLSFTLLTLGSILGRLGLDTVLLRSVAQRRGDGRAAVAPLVRRTVLMAGAGALAVAAVLYAAAGPLAGLVFGKPQLAGALRIAAFGVPPLALGLLSSQGLRGLKRVREYVFFDLVARFVAAGVCLPPALALVRPEYAPVLAFVLGSYLVAAANLVVLRRRVRALETDGDAGQPAPPPEWRAMLAMGLPLLLASSTVYLKGWVDTLMLGMYRTEAEVGVYNVALKLAALASLPLVAVNAIAAPRFAEASARGEPWRLRRTVEQSGRMILLSSLPIAVALAAVPRLWLGMFGPEAAAGATVLVVLSAAYLLNALAGSVGYLLQMIGKQVVFQNITLAVLASNIGLNALLVPRWGIEGAAVSTCVGVLLFNGACVAYLRHHLGFWTVPFMPGGRADAAPPPAG